MGEVRLLGGRGEGGFQERIVELIIAWLTQLDEHRRIVDHRILRVSKESKELDQLLFRLSLRLNGSKREGGQER